MEKQRFIKSIDNLVSSGMLTQDEIYLFIIPKRTLSVLLKQDTILSKKASSRLEHMLRVMKHAERAFGDKTKALRWLKKPKRQLNGKCPFDVINTEDGERSILAWLDKIKYGQTA